MLPWCLFWMLPSAASAGCVAQQTLTSSPLPFSRLIISSPLISDTLTLVFGVCTCSPHALASPLSLWPWKSRHNPRFRAGKPFFPGRADGIAWLGGGDSPWCFLEEALPSPRNRELNLAGRGRGNSLARVLCCLQNSKSYPWNSAR